MRRPPASLFAALLAVTFAPACDETSNSVLDPGAPDLAIRTEQSNVWEPFSLADVDNPCTPAIEAIDLDGMIHGIGFVSENGRFKSHYNVTMTGVDANGVKYLGTSTGNGKGEFPGSEAEDVVISTVINSQGGTDNFVTKIVLHFAADGTLRVEKGSEECRG